MAASAISWQQVNLSDTFITPFKVNGVNMGIQILGASSTLQNFTAVNATTSQATTTRFAISGLLSSLLKTNGSGSVVPAIAGTDYQAAGNYITALTGDVTASGPGSVAGTLATVNANTGSFGGSTAIPNFTVNGKGLITAAGTNAVIAPAGTLTGTTLASGVTASSLTSIGTLSSGAVPASLVTSGTFGSGNYTFPSNLIITGNSTTTQATTTNLAISGITGCNTTSALTTNSNGSVVCGAISGGGGAPYPFPLTGNATSTLTQFNGGLTALASSTIGNGTATGGLTISGNATTTGTMRANCFTTDGTTCVGTGSSTIPLFNAYTNPDTGGNAWFQPNVVENSSTIFGNMVAIASSTSAKTGFYGTFQVPEDFTSNPLACVIWSTQLTSGSVVWDFDYRSVGGNDTTSLNQGTFQESVTRTDTAPGAANRRMKSCMAVTAGNFAKGDTVEFYLARDGADGSDTLANGAQIYQSFFEYLK